MKLLMEAFMNAAEVLDSAIVALVDTPVSYTHLDVYKRQGVGSDLSAIEKLSAIFFNLDVYKRQGACLPASRSHVP